MTTRWARFVRGWIVALVSTLVAAVLHTLAGGPGPGVLPIVISLSFAGMICIALAGHTLSIWRGALAVLASQFIFHGLFALGRSGGAIPPDTIATSGTHHSLLPGIIEAAGTTAATHAGHFGPTMWLAHAVAAGITIVALRFGEGAFWSLLETARLIVRALCLPTLTVVVPPVLARRASTAWVSLPRNIFVLLSSVSRRGPPPVSLVA
ncbi:hypothetical protein [Cryobacterium psychrophilum]|uniref:Uncharacterized protein n=1 Tax=Cryobacterium psychrophilum TaxID=41988 RepID=A0A4Y8KN23_9MICO|nr:hypothetical protein [Cryobacterium psychrophilum]TDW29974.1 hypothetical protein EDD25_1700 [Cryobacterium psychrophilum]TFD76531.1 hypothetical protein E3T53_13735 [Cryobacterium psychrophilum]